MKRTISTLAVLGLSGVLVAGALGGATAAPKPEIVDVSLDANFVNDQGTGDGSFGDFAGPASPGTVSDIESVDLSNDAKNLYILFDTVAAPPATTGIGYRFRANPDGTAYCVVVEAMWPGANNDLTEAHAHFRDDCAGGEATEIEVLGSQLVVPRKLSKAFAKGAKLTAPQAQAFLWSGTYPTGVAGPHADTTKIGTDYTFKK
ncbi:MAG TPA: hypothetical protein VJ927_11570 [Actinomycetota bacterium]|nr:hypothetical protein [Actinomycetota bacterium]